MSARRDRRGGPVWKKKLSPVLENKTEIIAVIFTVAIAFTLLGIVSDYVASGDMAGEEFHEYEESVPTGPSDIDVCMQENPGISEDECIDIVYHREAIETGDVSLCESIVSERIRQHCLEYFD